ncbi:MAG: hypothetical protein JXR60_01400 [Bacteroidales bacterium]|nr:hypothetical protein [Bacteroidales bacterium]
MRYTFFSIVFSIGILFNSLYGQETEIKKNTVSLEIAGTGLFYSFHYDRYIMLKDNFRLSAEAGIMYIPRIENFSDFTYIIGSNLALNLLWGKSKHYAELGFSYSYIDMLDYDSNHFSTFYNPLRIGYRYQKDTGGLFFRVSFMPIFAIYQDPDVEILYSVTPHFGLSIGYSF